MKVLQQLRRWSTDKLERANAWRRRKIRLTPAARAQPRRQPRLLPPELLAHIAAHLGRDDRQALEAALYGPGRGPHLWADLMAPIRAALPLDATLPCPTIDDVLRHGIARPLVRQMGPVSRARLRTLTPLLPEACPLAAQLVDAHVIAKRFEWLLNGLVVHRGLPSAHTAANAHALPQSQSFAALIRELDALYVQAERLDAVEPDRTPIAPLLLRWRQNIMAWGPLRRPDEHEAAKRAWYRSETVESAALQGLISARQLESLSDDTEA
jgi:hypothetical protein